jgi:hypothetical protein
MALQVKFADLSSSLSLGADMRSHSRPHHPRVKPPLARFQRHRHQEKRNHSLPISSTHLTSLQAPTSPSFLTYRGKALEKATVAASLHLFFPLSFLQPHTPPPPSTSYSPFPALKRSPEVAWAVQRQQKPKWQQPLLNNQAQKNSKKRVSLKKEEESVYSNKHH